MAQTDYGDISPRTAGFVAAELLKRGIPYLVLEKFGQAKPLPNNKTKSVIFRRYNSLPFTPKPLTEGVTPGATALTKTDVLATVVQYGDRIEISDVVNDTHEDPILKEAAEVLGEQAANMIETVRYNVLKAGLNVFYANGTSRSAVNTPITTPLQRRITRALKRQNAKKITSIVRSTPSYGTQNVAPSFVGLIHPDLESDVRNMVGFVPTEQYGTVSPWENEIGKVEDVRYVYSTIFASFPDAGGAASTTYMTTSGTSADVYPVIYVGRDAYGIVPLKGQSSLTPMVVNPKPSDSDPMAQRGHVAWKSMQTAVILNDLWMCRLEVACTA